MAKEKIESEVKDKEVSQETEAVKDAKVENDTAKSKSKKKPQKKIRVDKKDQIIKDLEGKVDDLSDKHLRLQAEFDNFRRRTLKEKADLIKSAGESVLISLLPVADDFDRALEAMKEISDDDPAKQGIILIFNKVQDFLKQNNVKEIDAMNKEFDCDLHEAITKIPAPTEELKGMNVDVVQKGYMLGDKVIRFSKVVIGE